MRLLTKASVSIPVVVATWVFLSSAFPSVDFDDHVKRIIQSEASDGHDTAVIYALDTTTDRETRQTKRDLETLSSDPSLHTRSLSLQLTSGPRLRMSLERRAVDTSGARFREITEEGEREITVEAMDCFFSGRVEDGGEGEGGFASLALCDGQLVGSITTSTRDYDIHTLPDTPRKREEDDVMHVMVTWRDNSHQKRDVNDGLGIPDDDDDDVLEILEEDDTEAQFGRRSVADRRATVELADYVDRFYIQDVDRKLGITTNEEILQLIIAKWSAAAQILSDQNKVGWDLTLRLVSVVIMRTDPSWYQIAPQQTMGSRMKKICQNTKNIVSYDQITLHTGNTSDPNRVGLAWVGGLCRKGFRCSASRASNRHFRVELHELGHSLGLAHDGMMEECRKETKQIKGFMGGNPWNLRPCYNTVLNRTLAYSSHDCIFSNAYSTYLKEFT